jgi:hypothetical protein
VRKRNKMTFYPVFATCAKNAFILTFYPVDPDVLPG